MGTFDKKHVVSTWILAGKDFFISFEFEDRNRWHEYSTFFCHQGLKKICKAYFIANESENWKNLSEQVGLQEVNKAAKKKGHDLSKMIEELKVLNVLPASSISGSRQYTESELIKILQASYREARYPVPNPIYKKFPIPNRPRMYSDPIRETAPIHYSRRIASTVIRKIEKDFSILITVTSNMISSEIKEEEWIRFRSLFFKATINEP